jgi:glycosyltransferase involved in cell wall biosynthesis
MDILYSFRTRGVGAESVHISGIANALESLGHHVDFESPTGRDPRTGTGANPFSKAAAVSPLHAIAGKLPGVLFEFAEIAYDLQARKRISQRLSHKKYGLVYERHAFFLTSTSKVAAANKIPYAVEVNELVGDERIRKQPLLTPFAKKCDQNTFRNATRIITVSPHLKRGIIERYGIPEEKILVHPNAVESSLLMEAPDPAPFIRKYKLDGHLVVGFVGWFVEWHRLDLLLDAFANLAKTEEFCHARLLLVGDGPLKGALAQQASGLGIADKVIFTGPLSHSKVPAIVRAFDIAVIPHSNKFRSPIKLFEYMAQARPVIAPATEPITSVTGNGLDAIHFGPLDPWELKDSLTRLAKDRELRQNLGAKARQTVAKSHTWTHNARHLLEELGLPPEKRS